MLCNSFLIGNIKENNSITNSYYLTINITNSDQKMVIHYYTITDLNPFMKYNTTTYITSTIKKKVNELTIMFSKLINRMNNNQ